MEGLWWRAPYRMQGAGEEVRSLQKRNAVAGQLFFLLRAQKTLR